MRNVMKSLFKSNNGATAVEYGLIAGLIAVALVTAVGSLTGGLSTAFQNVGTSVQNSSVAPAA
jgi:pilus assembly protein Flp/PilA